MTEQLPAGAGEGDWPVCPATARYPFGAPHRCDLPDGHPGTHRDPETRDRWEILFRPTQT